MLSVAGPFYYRCPNGSWKKERETEYQHSINRMTEVQLHPFSAESVQSCHAMPDSDDNTLDAVRPRQIEQDRDQSGVVRRQFPATSKPEQATAEVVKIDSIKESHKPDQCSEASRRRITAASSGARSRSRATGERDPAPEPENRGVDAVTSLPEGETKLGSSSRKRPHYVTRLSPHNAWP